MICLRIMTVQSNIVITEQGKAGENLRRKAKGLKM